MVDADLAVVAKLDQLADLCSVALGIAEGRESHHAAFGLVAGRDHPPREVPVEVAEGGVHAPGAGRARHEGRHALVEAVDAIGSQVVPGDALAARAEVGAEGGAAGVDDEAGRVVVAGEQVAGEHVGRVVGEQAEVFAERGGQEGGEFVSLLGQPPAGGGVGAHGGGPDGVDVLRVEAGGLQAPLERAGRGGERALAGGVVVLDAAPAFLLGRVEAAVDD